MVVEIDDSESMVVVVTVSSGVRRMLHGGSWFRED